MYDCLVRYGVIAGNVGLHGPLPYLSAYHKPRAVISVAVYKYTNVNPCWIGSQKHTERWLQVSAKKQFVSVPPTIHVYHVNVSRAPELEAVETPSIPRG
jgi:hypothetical protein